MMVIRNWRTLVYKSHLWLGIASGLVIFIVCLTGSIYTFRAQIEDACNYANLFVDEEDLPRLPLDIIAKSIAARDVSLSQITIHPNTNRSIEISYIQNNGGKVVTCFVDPYSGDVLGERNSALSPFFEFILSLHKSLLLSDFGKQVVGGSVLVFVLMLLSGFVLWLPNKLRALKNHLSLKRGSGKARLLIDLHKVSGFYALLFLLVIAVMGLYISYPWVKNAFIVSLGGSPVISQANDEQRKKINEELANSFSESLARIMAQKKEGQTPIGDNPSLDAIMAKCDHRLPYKGIITIVLPNAENSWVIVKKLNRENWLKAILPDVLMFNQQGELKETELFIDKPLDKQFITLSLPLHTGEILGWPSLVVYFIASLVGALLPVTGSIVWYRRQKTKHAFKAAQNQSGDDVNREPVPSLKSVSCLILYGTKSGNSFMVARGAQKYLIGLGVDVSLKCMSNTNVDELRLFKYLLCVISTLGEGDPPPRAEAFFKQLDTADSMPHLYFSICALGDSAYEFYCEAGKQLENKLKHVNANELMERVDCDVEFGTPSSQWIKQLGEVIPNEKT